MKPLEPTLSRRRKRLALLAIVLLAAFLRLYRIGSLPPGDGYDPAWYGVDALQILRGHLPVYLPTNIGREAMFSYLVALSVAVFGIGPSAIHIASAVVGVATVPATYLAADALFAREKGSASRLWGIGRRLDAGGLVLAPELEPLRRAGDPRAPVRGPDPMGTRARRSDAAMAWLRAHRNPAGAQFLYLPVGASAAGAGDLGLCCAHLGRAPGAAEARLRALDAAVARQTGAPTPDRRHQPQPSSSRRWASTWPHTVALGPNGSTRPGR